MKIHLAGMGAAVVLVGALVSTNALAANSVNSNPTGCPDAVRVSLNDATCLTASWATTPATDGITAGTYAFSAENSCASYGTLHARAMFTATNAGDDDLDVIFVLEDSGAYSGNSLNARMTSASCCLDHSDLCYKNQVEKDSSGNITSITVSGTTVTTTTVDVSTHQNRYDFCQSNSDDVYCTNDPEGDANTAPSISISDCISKFRDSAASTDGCELGSSSTVTDDNECDLYVACRMTERTPLPRLPCHLTTWTTCKTARAPPPRVANEASPYMELPVTD